MHITEQKSLLAYGLRQRDSSCIDRAQKVKRRNQLS